MSREFKVRSEDRYARHRIIEWWDQDKLLTAHVMVCGAGAVGNEVIKLLALLGIGNVSIIDFDTIEISNLTRAVLFRESDVGKKKAEVAATRMQELNKDVKVEWIHGDLEFDIGMGVYRSMDSILGCLDSIDARLALNSICMKVGVPWINASIGAVSGEVAYYHPDEGGCYECAMSDAMWLMRNSRFSCGWLKNLAPEKKIATTATVASIAASYMVNELLLQIHEGKKKNIGLRPGSKLYFCTKPYSFTLAELPRSSDCYAHESATDVTILASKPDELTALDLIQQTSPEEDTLLELGFDLAVSAICPVCGKKEQLLRPMKRYTTEVLQCPNCLGTDRQIQTTSIGERESQLATRPLAELSIPRYQILSVKCPTMRKYYQLS